MTYNGNTYYYTLNLQGDVMALLDANGNEVVSYHYNAWGQIISTTASTTGMLNTLAKYNPLRYRGYVYDRETGLYYLQSRYYNPEICRFISADDISNLGLSNTPLGFNLYAYCSNNPVSMADSAGEFGIAIGIMVIGGVIGSVISAASSAITQYVLSGEVNWKSVGVAAATGFVSGAVAASPLGIAGQRVAGGIIGGVSYVADCLVNDKAVKIDEALLSVGMGVLSGQIGGPGANEGMVLSNTFKGARSTIAREARRANRKYAEKVVKATISSCKETFASATWASSFKFAAGCGVSNGACGKYSSLGLFPNIPSWNP